MKKRILSILFLSLPAFLLTAFIVDQEPESNLLRNLLNNLQNYYERYPQQKAYLHTDKDFYNVDERVWYKAYVVNATSHQPDKMSSNLYVDLINPSGYVVQKNLLRLSEGTARGDFTLQDTVPEGRYKLRAYTNWMRNSDKDFLFTRDIYVRNPYFTTYATKTEVNRIKRSYRQTARKSDLFDITFHPEGGSLLSGVENVVAYKAINGLGMGVDFEGQLVDKKGNIIANIQSEHLGMGTFRFTPEPEEKYFVNASFTGEKEEKFTLPKAIDMGVNLKIDHLADDHIMIHLNSNLTAGNYPANTNYHLIAHTRGNARFTAELDLIEKPRISVSKDKFPNGIVHFTLFNSSGNPVSERLVFVYNNPVLTIDILQNKSEAGKREKMKSTIRIRDEKGNPVEGSFSLAVVENSRLTSNKNILSELLLSSDLKGNIEKSDYYFNEFDELKAVHLDNLLLTQGWRRFDWGLVQFNKKMPVEYKVEEGIEINGRITREFFGLPLSDIRVTLTILSEYNDVFTTRSGPKGYFSFKNLNYADTVGVKLEAVRKSGRKNLVIVLNQQDPLQIEDMNYITDQYIRRPGEKGRWVSVEDPEEIEKQNDPFYEENNRYYRIHQEPNDVIVMDDNLRNYSSLAEILQGRVPGVMVSGNNITIRGVNSFYGETDPLFIVDGVTVDKSFALNMNPLDIDRIEILKGPEAAIYGAKGGNGVIAIFTKRGKFMLKGVLDFNMLGYHTPKEFYSPKYEITDKDDGLLDDRTTLYWEPFLETDHEGKQDIEFYTSDMEGDYSIIVEGMDKNGTPGTGKLPFRIQ
ncbi:MAG: TonB-dependent receptor plug domain-containing protein [Bacteroidota bacterium]